MIKKLTIILALVLAMCAPALAGGIIDFGIAAPTTGTIVFDPQNIYAPAGASSRLIGINIQVDNVTGIGTPLNNGVTFAIPDGLLNFVTSPIIDVTADEWHFGAGGPGSIVLTGTVPGDGAGTLLTGSMTDVHVHRELNGTFTVAIASFLDTKNTHLTSLFGMPSDIPYSGNFNLSFTIAGSSTPNLWGSFISNPILSGDLTNTPVPLPPSTLLLGSGLLGLVGFGWRRRKTT